MCIRDRASTVSHLECVRNYVIRERTNRKETVIEDIKRKPVSYTHLDVYKRQPLEFATRNSWDIPILLLETLMYSRSILILKMPQNKTFNSSEHFIFQIINWLWFTGDNFNLVVVYVCVPRRLIIKDRVPWAEQGCEPKVALSYTMRLYGRKFWSNKLGWRLYSTLQSLFISIR